jgi:photosystem II stability/assembly factor-like uncharacterized protein
MLRILQLILDNQNGILYALVNNGYIIRSYDRGITWQEPKTIGLDTNHAHSLVLDNNDGTLYVGNSNGIYRSVDGGDNWQAANNGLEFDEEVLNLIIDSQDGTLFVRTMSGIFHSTTGGTNWQLASTEFVDTNFYLAYHDSDDSSLVGYKKNVVYRSVDKGVTWQPASSGYENALVVTLFKDDQNGQLFAGTSGGLFISIDGGVSWKIASVEMEGLNVISLMQDDIDGSLYAGTYRNGVFRSQDRNESWYQIKGLQLLWALRHYEGYVLRLANTRELLWVVEGENPLWNQFVQDYNINILTASYQKSDNSDNLLLDSWGATILYANLSTFRSQSLLFMAVRTWVINALNPWVARNFAWLASGFVLLSMLLLTRQYFNTTRSIEIKVLPFFFARHRLSMYAKGQKLDLVWQNWQVQIEKELLRYGDVIPADLLSVPAVFRRYAIIRYHELYGGRQTIELIGNRLRLLAGDRLERWHTAWGIAGRELGQRAGISERCRLVVDELCSVMKESLGLHIIQQCDFAALRIYLVEAPALRLNLPLCFPLIFLADPQPDDATIQALVDAVEVLKERGYFALVVPLEPLARTLDIPAELRRVVEHSPYAQDFIVLNQDDILNMLAARQPQQALAIPIGRQRNMTTLSPFIVNGPVPEQMFFGREDEVRTLVESAVHLNHAIIGNRKIGKTSLLDRVAARLKVSENLLPIRMDCQDMPDAASFYRAFQGAAELKQSIHTNQDFAEAIKMLRTHGKAPLLLLDEVDILLAAEKGPGELLVSTWRALAQAGECRFIFCGSGGLARHIGNAKSAFFNFPQALTLGYLSAAEAHLVVAQPMEMLGIEIEDEDAFHEKMLSMTSGHPNLVQYLGRELVGIANLRQEKCIQPGDPQTIQDTSAYAKFYFETIWGAVTPMEKLVTLLTPPEAFRVGNVQALLENEGVPFSEEELDQALELLTVYAILERKGREYSFVPQAFHAMLNETQEVERLIRAEKRKHNKERV